MKRTHLLFLLSTLFLFNSSVLLGQVLNGDARNYVVQFKPGSSPSILDGNGSVGEPIFIFAAAPDNNNFPQTLFSTSANVGQQAQCYGWVVTPGNTNSSGRSVAPSGYINIDNKNGGSWNNLTTTKIDYHVMAYENDGGGYCSYDSGDDDYSNQIGIATSTASSQSRWVSFVKIMSPVNHTYSFRHAWNYVAGVWGKELEFGLIDDGNTYSHENRIWFGETGMPAEIEARNQWTGGAFSSGAEMNYSFSISSSKKVTIRTNYSETTFGNRLHIIKLGEAPNYNYEEYITGSSNSSGGTQVEAYLCAGNYGIVVEGYGSNDKGFFKLTAQAEDFTFSGGSISDATSIVPFPSETDVFVTELTAENALPDFGSYGWEQRENVNGIWQAWEDVTVNQDSSAFLIPEINQNTQFRRKVFNTCGDFVYSTNERTFNAIFPNGILNGQVVSRSGAPVQGVTITAVRTTAVEGSAIGHSYTAETGSDGVYTFDQLYYGNTATGSGASAAFTITPSKNIHIFNPTSLPRTFTQTNPSPANANFTDETTFSITGTITQECDDCVGATPGNPVICVKEDVELLIDNVFVGNKSLADGTYSLSVDNQGTYEIKPRFLDHEFEPDEVSLDIGEEVEVSNINFKDTTTHRISGVVRAGCDQYFEQAKLRFIEQEINSEGDTVTACFVKEVTTNLSSGFYDVQLPAGMYKVDVFGFENLNADFNALEIEAFFDNLLVDSLFRDISTEDATINLTFHEAPQLTVSGLNAPCINLTTPIFEQNVEKAFTVLIYEGNPIKGCFALDDSVTISTNVHADDVVELFKYKTEGGILDTSFVGGSPNIVSPYQKVFNIDFTDNFGRNAATVSYTPVVTGLKPRTGTFATVSPEIPFLILRDPPGDLSYSYWENSTTAETAMRFYSGRGGSVEKWREVKLGVQFEAGVEVFGVSVATNTEIWGSVKGSLEFGANIRNSREAIVSMQTTQRYETSDDTQVVGEKGDVFIGAAMNLLYAITDEVVFDAEACSLFTTKDLIIANNGFATEYMYTEGHIRNTLIPNLENIRGITSDDSTKLALTTQISVWEQALERNRELKRQATYDKNVSFDGASGPQESSTTSSSTSISTIEFDMFIDASIATEAGIEIAGSGTSGGSTYKFKFEAGASTTQTTTNSTTTGFVIDDNDDGDFLSVNIKNDPVYNTPVFETVSGTTSCPHEEGTQARDGIQLTVLNPFLQNVPAGGTAQFNLQLANTSESEETRTYFLRYIQGSAPGATVTVEGNPAIVPFAYTLNYLEQQDITIGVSRFNNDIYSFEDIRFEAIDACGLGTNTSPDKRKEVSMAAFFQNACSPVTLSLPEEDFVVNSSFNNQVPVTIKDYVWANLTDVSLEYAAQGSSSWISAFTLNQGQLQNSSFGTSMNWDISNVNDGAYKLRLKLRCGSSVVYSSIVNGVIDRQFPVLVSKPQPADDNYVLGDQISASFNQELGCLALNSNNVTVTKLSDNSVVSATLGCFQNTLTIMPDASLLSFIGDSVEVRLVSVEGENGNVNPNVILWNFDIGTPPLNSNSLPEINLTGAVAGVAVSNTFTNGNARIAATANALQFNEDGTAKLELTFSISAAQPNDVTVNYFVSGDAVYQLDFDVIGELTNDGFAGTALIEAGQTSVTITIDAIDDAIFENDEEVFVTLERGGDYFIGSNNQVTATILNDDTLDDCENNGNVYELTNVEVTPGTYHKSRLESDVTINTPTTVIFKGERSITLNPGFEISGSTFSAIIEDCPDNVVASTAIDFSSFSSYGVTSNSAEKSVASALFSTQSLTNKDEVVIPFESLTDQKFTVILLNKYASELTQLITASPYPKGSNNFTFSTKDLPAGTYFLKFIGEAETLYHQVIFR